MEQLPIFQDKEFQGMNLADKRKYTDMYVDKKIAHLDVYKNMEPEMQQAFRDDFADAQISYKLKDTLDIIKNFRDKQVAKFKEKQNKPAEQSEQSTQPTPEENLDHSLFVSRNDNKLTPSVDPFHQVPTTKEEALQQVKDIQHTYDADKKLREFQANDAPLEDDTLNLAFAGGGLTRAAQGVVAKQVATTTAEKLAAEKMIAGGQAFAKGDVVGNVAAQGAMGATDEMISDEFKKSHPLTAGLIEMGAGLLVGGYAGIKAENQVMKKYADLQESVKAGKVTADDAEKILSEDDNFMKQYNDASQKQAAQKVEDNAYNARTPDEVVNDTQSADEFLKATKPKKVSEETNSNANLSSYVDDSGHVVLTKQAEPDPIVDGFESLKKQVVGDNEEIVPHGYSEPVVEKPTAPEPMPAQKKDVTDTNVGDIQTPPSTASHDELLQHPRLNELLDMRKDVLAKDIQNPNKLIQKGGSRELSGNGGTDKMTYDKAQYEKNYGADFELTKQDIAKIKAGNIDEEIAGKLERDLGVLDNHPDWNKASNNIDYSQYKDTPKDMSPKDWEEANTVFNKWIDNVAVGTYAGVDTDENGNLTFDPAKFVLGLGGYTAVKTALKNKVIQGKLKEYAKDAVNKIDMNPAVYKENGISAMSPIRLGDNSNSTIKDVKETLSKHRGSYEHIEYNKKNWDNLFPNNQVDTPLGKIKLGENKHERLDPTIPDPKNPTRVKQDRRNHLSYIEQTLKEPAFAVNKDNGEKLLFFKEIDKNGKNKQYSSIMIDKDGMHINISNHPMNYKQIKSEINKNDVVYVASEDTASKTTKPNSSSEIVDNAIIPQEAEKVKWDESFKKWFNGSKVVDSKGKPLVVYHGTNSEFETFKTKAPLFTKQADGAYFTSHKSNAKKYGNKIHEVYLDIKKPLEIDAEGKTFNEFENLDNEIKWAEKDGYDGVIINNLKDSKDGVGGKLQTTYVVFEPTQIKSIHNKGTFDATDANILHANGSGTLAGSLGGATLGGMSAAYDDIVGGEDLSTEDYFDRIILGAGAGLGLSAIARVKPTWLNDGFVRGEKSVKVGMFAGDGVTVTNKAQKAFNEGKLKKVDTLPDETYLQLTQRKFQDKFNRVKQLINLKADMNTIDDVLNPYQAEELMHGKVQAKLSDLETQTVTPIIEKIAKAKLTTDKVDEYLWARHAPERNKKMYELHAKPTEMSLEDVDATLLKYKDSGIKEAIKEAENNKNTFYGKFTQKNVDEYEKAVSQKKIHDANAKISKSGSGMSDEDAYKIIYKYKDNKAMNEIAQDVYAMNRDRLKLIRDEGLESDEFIQVLEGLYDNYVPLKREFGTEDKAAFTGRGFDIKGRETKRAKGSDRKVESPLMHSILAYEETIVRAGKNEVGKTFLNFAEKFPDDALYSIADVKHKAIYDKNGAVVGVDTLYKKDDNVLHVKIDGKIKEITIHDHALASAFKNLNTVQMEALLKASHKAIRLIASLNTSYNPEFVISNFERDIQTAMINLPDNMKSNRARILKDVLPALNGIYEHSVKGIDNKWGELFNELKHEGGTTGWNEIHSVQDIKKSTEAIVNKYNGKVMPKEAARKVLNYIDNINDAVENSTRLVAYKMAKESGLSNAKAASIAKNLTVNFNRRGEFGATVNSLYMFYNASIQGTARMMSQLKNSNKAKGIVLGIAGSAIGLDYINRSTNADAYEKIPDYIKDTNFIFMNEDGTYETMQLPYGYNIFKAVGDVAANAYHGEIELKDIPTRILSMSVNAFSPIGVDADSAIHTVLPTLIKPFYEIETNKNFFGGNISPEDNPFEPQKPDSQKYFKSVNPVAKTLSQKLNEYTGGNMAKSGLIDVSPETIEHLVGFATGGVGRLLMNIETVSEQYIKDKKVDANKIPFARKFYHTPREKEEVNLVYELGKKSATEILSPLQRRRFYKWMDEALKKKDLTKEQSDKLKKTFNDNQNWQEFAKKHDLQSAQDFTDKVQEDSYDNLNKSQIIRILRAKEKGK